MMIANEIIVAKCRTCKQPTNHVIKANYDRSNGEIIDSLREKGEDATYIDLKAIHYSVLECCGCETIQFRELEAGFKYNGIDENGNYNYASSTLTEIFHPKYDDSILYIQPIRAIDSATLIIYKEIVSAFNNKLFLMCTYGLRAIIESICNHLKIKVPGLPQKIEAIYGTGLLSRSASDSLHHLKFLGNQALHNQDIPEEIEISTGIQIIELVLKEIYEMPLNNENLRQLITDRVSR